MNAPAHNAPGFAGVTYQDALARALDLVPRLRERAPRAEEERVMLPETLADLHRTGLLRVLQPKRWGGMELDYVAYVDFSEMTARGCASTGWNVGNLLIHHWMLALYDERAQQEVWGENPEALIASGIAYPQGSGKRVPGGISLSGRWNFSSGVLVASKTLLALEASSSCRRLFAAAKSSAAFLSANSITSSEPTMPCPSSVKSGPVQTCCPANSFR